MHGLYLASVTLHILAAVTWIGGMFFLVLVVVPWLRRGNRAAAGAFLRETGLAFRTVGWVCFGILVVTGTFNLWVRGVRLETFANRAWLASSAGHAVTLKLLVFALVIAVSAVHDFRLGPRAAAEIEADPDSHVAHRLRRQASWLGRVNVLFALALVVLGVIIVRGW
ncbi:MAG: CopD family protein [Polyangiaceae bacterium]|nr:CopD family protein [Polyangiaceae bacterium]